MSNYLDNTMLEYSVMNIMDKLGWKFMVKLPNGDAHSNKYRFDEGTSTVVETHPVDTSLEHLKTKPGYGNEGVAYWDALYGFKEKLKAIPPGSSCVFSGNGNADSLRNLRTVLSQAGGRTWGVGNGHTRICNDDTVVIRNVTPHVES